jgi:hypothetical protein
MWTKAPGQPGFSRGRVNNLRLRQTAGNHQGISWRFN